MSEHVIEGRYHPSHGHEAEDWELLLDGVKLDAKKSQKVFNHSPDGLAWGYGGSAPAQAALAILLAVTEDEKVSLALHNQFMHSVLMDVPMRNDFTLTLDIEHWVEEQQRSMSLP
jgi:hypothetical protein